MKKIILSFALMAGLVSAAFGSGIIPIDSTSSGVFTMSSLTGLTTNVPFTSLYSRIPIVQLFPTTTNNSPITLGAITPTNFAVTVTTASATNISIFWRAYPASPLIQTGTNTATAGTPLLVTFPTPFAFAPFVTTGNSTTNTSAIVGASGVTATNFTATGSTTGPFSWAAIGQTFSVPNGAAPVNQ